MIACKNCIYVSISPGMVQVPFCEKSSTTKIDPLSGSHVWDSMDEWFSLNKNGDCPHFKQKPQRKGFIERIFE